MVTKKHHMYIMEKSRKKYIIEKAESFVLPYSVPPIPVLEIAERNDVDVVFSDLKQFSDNVSGFIDFQNSKMLVNDEMNLKQKAFTMAHEFGHWILHKELFESNPSQYAVMPRMQRPDLTSKFEVEANLFASRLLMPAHLLDCVKGNPVSTLARVFMVSQTDMSARLTEY